ncbi:MAG: aryl-sulfate sulfotransferase [Bacteroidetes bacterium]|nr:aryl-sulfate sulfotransferase [Bacteroidota bacterium]
MQYIKRIFYPLILSLFFIKNSNAQQQDGYILYSVMGSTSTQLIDTNGTITKTWKHTSKSGYSCYLMPGGFLWRSAVNSTNYFSGGPINGLIEKIDYNGNILWSFVYSTYDYCTHHDICPMPNGNVLLIAYERKSAAQVTAAGSSFNGEVWSEKVVEIKPTGATTGEIVWEWKVWDHLVQDYDSTKANYNKYIVNHPELLNVNYKITKDWIHMNGIDYNPILDQIAVSSHNLNEWYIIDHSTTTAEAATHSGGNSGKGGDFLYRWGNPLAYKASGTQVLNVTHDVHWIPEGYPNEGRLVGFNNKGVSSSKSSVDQIVPPVNEYNYELVLGKAYEPSTYFRHPCNGYTSNAGSSDQLKNGNMLVCIALSGYLYEIDANQKSIWSKTVTGSIQQAHHYEKCIINNEPPEMPEITKTNDTLFSSQAHSYQWYLNGQKIIGETNQKILPSKNGIYLVRTTDNNACIYRYSKGFKFEKSNTSELNQVKNYELLVYPNPAQNTINISKPENLIISKITIIDFTGKIVYEDKFNSIVNIENLKQGFYSLKLISDNNSINFKINIIR